MARISGIDLPRDKRIEVALTYIYGIGPARAAEVLNTTGINPDIRVKDLTEEQESLLRDAIAHHYLIEGDLRRETAMNIKRLNEIGCYRGLRHRRGLPVLQVTENWLTITSHSVHQISVQLGQSDDRNIELLSCCLESIGDICHLLYL